MPSRLDRASFGPLYDLLFERFPRHRSAQGLLDVDRMAGDLGVSHETFYRWLRKNKLAPKWAKALLDLNARDRRDDDPELITLEKLTPFVFA